jgi:hypothetical protein
MIFSIFCEFTASSFYMRSLASVGKPEGKRSFERQGVDGRVGSKWILGRLAGSVWNGFTWLRIRTGNGLF